MASKSVYMRGMVDFSTDLKYREYFSIYINDLHEIT